MKTMISVCIISNKIDNLLIKTVQSYLSVVDEVCVGFNRINDIISIESFKSKFPTIQIYEIEWQGYGGSKNTLNSFAKHDWILSIDADEVADSTLQKTLNAITHLEKDTVYEIKMKNHFGNRYVRFGAWGMGKRYFARLFNKKSVQWDTKIVHESLKIPQDFYTKKLKGSLLHYTANNMEELISKSYKYAMLSAERKALEGKRSDALKPYLSAFITLFKELILKFGFLDGKAGLQIAYANAYYSFHKYLILSKKVERVKP